jgi:hypothetical protein
VFGGSGCPRLTLPVVDLYTLPVLTEAIGHIHRRESISVLFE